MPTFRSLIYYSVAREIFFFTEITITRVHWSSLSKVKSHYVFAKTNGTRYIRGLFWYTREKRKMIWCFHRKFQTATVLEEPLKSASAFERHTTRTSRSNSGAASATYCTLVWKDMICLSYFTWGRSIQLWTHRWVPGLKEPPTNQLKDPHTDPSKDSPMDSPLNPTMEPPIASMIGHI